MRDPRDSRIYIKEGNNGMSTHFFVFWSLWSILYYGCKGMKIYNLTTVFAF